MSRFEGSVAIVTGGATGIGRAVALSLADEGAAAVVVPWSRSQADAEDVVRALGERGAAGFAPRADVQSSDQVDAAVAGTLERFGRLDHLVNGAGATRLIPFDDLGSVTDADWDLVLDTNLRGAFRYARAAAPALRAARGSIVNITSIAAHRAVGSSLPYGVSKAGLVQLTRSLALALAPDVRVNSVSPGTVASRWHGALIGDDEAARARDREAAAIPLGRVADPDDVADMVLSLLAARFTTGQDVIVDGGKHLRY